MGIDVDAMPRSCNSADLSNDRGLFWTLMVTVHGESYVTTHLVRLLNGTRTGNQVYLGGSLTVALRWR
jgi:hypothetical protein